MGFKRRSFTSALKAEILQILADGDGASKAELLDRLRGGGEVRASVQRLSLALGRLIAEGQIEMVGARAAARFRQVRSGRPGGEG